MDTGNISSDEEVQEHLHGRVRKNTLFYSEQS